MKKSTSKTKAKAAPKKKTVAKAAPKTTNHFTVPSGKTSYWPPKDKESLYYIIYAGKKGKVSLKPRDQPQQAPPPQFLPQAMPIMPNGDGTFTITYSTTAPSSTPGSTASTPESTD